MAVQWALGGGENFAEGPPGAETIGPWMVEHLPLVENGVEVWGWRQLFFLSLVLAGPFVWEVTRHVRSAASRWSTRAGLVTAASAIALEYNTPGYGWLFDLVALVVMIIGTVACGVSALRSRTLPRRVAWPLVAALPLTPVGGFLTFWYLPPGLTIGVLIAYAIAAGLAKS